MKFRMLASDVSSADLLGSNTMEPQRYQSCIEACNTLPMLATTARSRVCRGRREDDGGVHSPRPRLRGDLPTGGRLHGPRVCGERLLCVCGYLRGLRRRVRAASAGALPKLRAGVPPLRRGVSPDVECSCGKTTTQGQGRPMTCH